MKQIIVIMLIYAVVLFELFIILKNRRQVSEQQREIDNQKYLNAYLADVVALQRGKRYRIEGDKILILRKENGEIGAMEFTAGDVVFFQIGCVAEWKKQG